jgi:triacylglycerol lipase
VQAGIIYPMIDDRTPDTSHPFVGEFMWKQEDNDLGWAALLGHEPGGDCVSPYAAAARAENLAGLPSTFISVGTLDLFLESNLEYARRLTRSGVPVEFYMYPGAFHGFDMATESALAQAHARDQVNALRKAFTRQ